MRVFLLSGSDTDQDFKNPPDIRSDPLTDWLRKNHEPIYLEECLEELEKLELGKKFCTLIFVIRYYYFHLLFFINININSFCSYFVEIPGSEEHRIINIEM